ncbi:MAG: MBL fold metallo-hydrolase [Candidatus Hydrogenedentota bacterium]|nr:MAG: MBL fold metallo-hydrolase [Candidatus Hydrogenedentota bacterium]
MIFKQIPTGMMANFAYIFGCEKAKRAAVVDPPSNISEIVRFAEENGLKIELIFATHSHSDHTAGIRSLAERTGAKVVVHKGDAPSLQRGHIPTDRVVEDGEKLKVGDVDVEVIHTPGHTPGSMCLLANGKLMTGDTLFVGNCGRTDLAGSSTRQMYDSLHKKLKTLSDDVQVYPGHDYGDRPSSTIAHERKSNPTLTCASFEEFEMIP